MLLDLAVYARFLIALPLLLAAEELADRRFVDVARTFVTSGLRRPKDTETFAVMLALAVVGSIAVVLADARDGVPSWRTLGAAGAERLSLAGWWTMLVSQPLFQFMLLYWLWRLLI